jgi:hypothetical protein
VAWVRLDEHFSDHPKIVSAGPLGAWLYVAGLCYCNRLLTNGFIPLSQVDRLAPHRQDQDIRDSPMQLAERLCTLGLWGEGTRKGVAGYIVHDFLKYQPSKKHVMEARAKSAERQGRFQQRHRHAPRNAPRNAVSNAVSNAPRNGGSNAAPDPDPGTKKQPTVVVAAKPPPDPRVKEFLTWFQAEYILRRHGAAYLVSWAKHSAIVKEMLVSIELDRLKKYAQIMLSDKTDDEFIIGGDRGIEVLRAKCNWLSDRLSTWETRHPVPA